MARKIVRFYELRCVTNSNLDRLTKYNGRFWPDLGEKVTPLGSEDRTVGPKGRQLYGEYRQAMQPAVPYFYIGRVRSRSDWPDTLDRDSGVTRL